MEKSSNIPKKMATLLSEFRWISIYYFRSKNYIQKEGVLNFLKMATYRSKLFINNTYKKLKFKRILKNDDQVKKNKTYSNILPSIPYTSRSANNNVAFTIVSKNYLPMAFTLAKSFKLHNPCWDFKILLCDMLVSSDEYDYIKRENDVEVVPLYALHNFMGLDLEEMCFKYSVIEMNTGIKPFFLDYLFNLNYEKVIYFDPDILILNPITELDNLLENNDVILTPHILSAFPNDNKKPDEFDIIKAGTYNLGFIALKKSNESINLVKWWEKKLKDYCFMKVDEGMHVDQKWIEFVPSYFKNVLILRKKNYNVAYWNLHERNLSFDNEKWLVDEEPLIFFHFSGFMVEDIDSISKHQNRYKLSDFKEIGNLFNMYKNMLIEEEIIRFRTKPYWFDFLPGTNIRIPEFFRSEYKDVISLVKNPYNPQNIESMINVVNNIILSNPNITKLWYNIYLRRTDLQNAFPNLKGDKHNRLSFVDWINTSGKKEYGLNEIFINVDNNNLTYPVNPNFGINIYGYFNGIFGVAETSRLLFKTILMTGVPLSLRSVSANDHEDLKEDNFTTKVMKEYLSKINPYNVNLFVINADQLPNVIKEYCDKNIKNNYNIGFWAWELEDYFPFEDSFNYLDEIWYFSDFACNIYRKYTDKPVIKITYPFQPTWDYIISKDDIYKEYNIPNNNFTFFFNFDFHSSFERKNPEGVIKAFNKAFNNEENVTLILKTLHADYYSKEKKILSDLIGNNKRIIWIDTAMTKEEMISLLNVCDCYVSMHRSEGFGLGMAEAMYLGKCVLATAYGGNMEFMNDDNSILIDYQMVGIKEDYGPYKNGILWADPDIEDAIKKMRMVYQDKSLVENMGKKASEDIKKYLDPKKTVIEISERLFHNTTNK